MCLAHSYTFAQHELLVGEIARAVGFTHVSLSSQLTPMIKLIPRGMSAMADAYLTPTVKRYLDSFSAGFEGSLASSSSKGSGSLRCQMMQSDGGLVDFQRFSGLRAILSGPAGGVVGYARTSFDSRENIALIGIDMGGTSTE